MQYDDAIEPGGEHTPPQPPAEGMPWPCIHCGYDLRRLPADRRCPECGEPIADSMPRELLYFSPTSHLRSLRTGVVVIAVGLLGGMVLGLAGGIVGAVMGMRNPNRPLPGELMLFMSAIGVVTGVVSFAGWWMFTAEDHRPHETIKPVPMRAPTRVLAIVQLLLGVGAAAMSIMSTRGVQTQNPLDPVTIAASVTSFLVAAGFWIVAMLYVRQLAHRSQDRSLQRQMRTYVWLVPVLMTAGVLLCGLGPLIATILALGAMFGLRAQVGRILQARPPERGAFG